MRRVLINYKNAIAAFYKHIRIKGFSDDPIFGNFVNLFRRRLRGCGNNSFGVRIDGGRDFRLNIHADGLADCATGGLGYNRFRWCRRIVVYLRLDRRKCLCGTNGLYSFGNAHGERCGRCIFALDLFIFQVRNIHFWKRLPEGKLQILI